jgi:transglutaminase-like putative cysteine protease
MNETTALTSLRWLLVALGLVLILHATHLVPWVPLLAFLLGVWRYVLARKHRPLPGMKILLPITLAGALGILVSYGGLFGRDAGVALLTLMTALKTMETRSRRDITLVIYLGYFLCICAFLFSQAIPVALFMALPVIALTATLIGLNHANGELPADHKLKLAGLMLVQAAPVMIAMFVLFPRVPGPLWGIPQDMARGMTGLSDDMSPGSISQLSRSDAVAFRAVFKGAPPTASGLYWRGPVFWHYDGRTWRAGDTSRDPLQTLASPKYKAHSVPVEYTVTLEPHNKPWLFLLELPVKLPGIGALTSDYQYLSRLPVRQRLRYDAASSLKYMEGSTLDERTRRRALQLPPFGNQRSRALAAQWRSETPDPQALVQRALAMYRADFTYTLTPPTLGSSAVDGFLFDTRRGFCEHYAGSFVFLMRAAGIPARVVTGYQGGQANPMGDYLIVRQSDAHAWAEVWLDGQGWVRIDPTAAVSPQRVELGISAALPDTEPLPMLARPQLTWLKRLNLGWDVVDNGWNQWVLGYNQQRQMEFLAKLAGGRIDWGDMTLWLTGLLTLIVGSIAALMLREALPRTDPAHLAWLRFQKKLARAGVAIFPHEGPRDFTHRSARQLPKSSQQIERIGVLYLLLRYRARKNAQGIAQLQHLVREFRPK